MHLVLRLAGPAQAWVGYRVGHDYARTEPVPTKSGVAGLLGACLGERQHLELIPQFDLRARVDRSNPGVEDLQVAARPRAGLGTELWHRAASLAEVSATVASGSAPKAYRAKGIDIVGGSLKVEYSPHRSFMPSAEYVCSVTVGSELGGRLLQALRRPVFMPYLGRRANPMTYPYFLGVAPDEMDLLGALPTVRRSSRSTGHGERARLRTHHVTGSYAEHVSSIDEVEVPVVESRTQQLEWAEENLER